MMSPQPNFAGSLVEFRTCSNHLRSYILFVSFVPLQRKHDKRCNACDVLHTLIYRHGLQAPFSFDRE